MNTTKAVIKWLLSFTKSKWEFKDYPVRTWKNLNAGEKKVAFGAGIINWALMVGQGETNQSAIEELKKRFHLFRDNNPSLPRPGSKVSIKFVSTEKIDKYEDLAINFFQKILGMDYHQGFYSDSSSLPLFEPLEEEQAKKMKPNVIQSVLKAYKVDITDIYEQPLYVIFDRIKNKNRSL